MPSSTREEGAKARCVMQEHFDGQRAFSHIEALARLRRLAGTPGEEQARAYISDAGNNVGVPMRSEEFTYSTVPLTVWLPGACLLLSAICLAGSLAYLWETTLVIIPGALLLIILALGFRWAGAFEYFGTVGGSKRSANLLGEIKGKNPNGVIVLSAHYDTKSQLIPAFYRAALFILGFFTAALLGLALITVGILAATGRHYPGSHAGFYASLFPAICLFLLVFNFTGNRSPGALDNASGEAVILEAARILKREPLENFDVIIASFGCEEIGLCGSINYLLAHEEELKSKPTYMLNIDMPFSQKGKLYINTAFELPPKRTSEHLFELSRIAAAEMGVEIRGAYLPVGAAADHVPWTKHGIEATGFVGAAGYIHSAGDNVGRINREALRKVGELVLSVARKLDEEVSAS